MLRNRRHLLKLAICTGLFFSLRPATVQAQLDDNLAPWRLETFDTNDLEPPDPVDVNKATYDELMKIPGLAPAQARSLIRWRQEQGPLQDVDQIQQALNCDPDEFEALLRYLAFTPDSSLYDLRTTCRYQQENSSSVGGSSSLYRIGPKTTLRGRNGIFLGLALEKDPGETQIWDHSALTAAIPLPEVHGCLVLGDFLVGFGRGLVISTARNYGLGRDAQANLRPYFQGIKPYNGWQKDLALRGAALETQFYGMELTAWGSSRRRDVSLDSTGAIQSFNALAKNQSREDSWGGRLESSLLSRRLTVGGTFYRAAWDRPVQQGNALLSHAGSAGFDLSWSDSALSASIEAAWDDHRHTAQMGVLGWKSRVLALQQALYRIDPNYYSPLASSLDLGQGEVSNKEGSYSSLSYQFPYAAISGFLHLYRYPCRLTGQSWGGEDLSLSTEAPLDVHVRLRLAARWIQEQLPDSFVQYNRWRASGDLFIQPASRWELKAGFQVCRSELLSWGQLLRLGLGHEVRLGPASGLEVLVNSGFYMASDYSERLYWIEGDRSGTLSVRSLWGDGEAVQITVDGWKRRWGQAAVSLWWNHPDPGSQSKAASDVTVVYRYP